MRTSKEISIEQIKIIKNFVSKEEIDFYINYINKNLHLFIKDETFGESRYTLFFGKDNAHGDKLNLNFDKVKDIEDRLRNDLFPRVEQKIKEIYKNKKDFMVSSFFMAKQSSGGQVPEHIDTDAGLNLHYKYGGAIYLNTMSECGKLEFPDLDYEYSPEAGDFVIFPSRPSQYKHKVAKICQDRYSLPIWVTEYAFWKL